MDTSSMTFVTRAPQTLYQTSSQQLVSPINMKFQSRPSVVLLCELEKRPNNLTNEDSAFDNSRPIAAECTAREPCVGLPGYCCTPRDGKFIAVGSWAAGKRVRLCVSCTNRDALDNAGVYSCECVAKSALRNCTAGNASLCGIAQLGMFSLVVRFLAHPFGRSSAWTVTSLPASLASKPWSARYCQGAKTTRL